MTVHPSGGEIVVKEVAVGPVDGRDYSAAAAVLRSLGIGKVRLLTNNPAKCEALQMRGIEVSERVALVVPPNPSSSGYLQTKAARMGHLLDGIGRDEQAEPET